MYMHLSNYLFVYMYTHTYSWDLGRRQGCIVETCMQTEVFSLKLLKPYKKHPAQSRNP